MKTRTTIVPELRHVQALARYAYETACAVLPGPPLAWDAVPLTERYDLLGRVVTRATGVVYDRVFGHPVQRGLLPYAPEWLAAFDDVVDALASYAGRDWTTFEAARERHALLRAMQTPVTGDTHRAPIAEVLTDGDVTLNLEPFTRYAYTCAAREVQRRDPDHVMLAWAELPRADADALLSYVRAWYDGAALTRLPLLHYGAAWHTAFGRTIVRAGWWLNEEPTRCTRRIADADEIDAAFARHAATPHEPIDLASWLAPTVTLRDVLPARVIEEARYVGSVTRQRVLQGETRPPPFITIDTPRKDPLMLRKTLVTPRETNTHALVAHVTSRDFDLADVPSEVWRQRLRDPHCRSGSVVLDARFDALVAGLTPHLGEDESAFAARLLTRHRAGHVLEAPANNRATNTPRLMIHAYDYGRDADLPCWADLDEVQRDVVRRAYACPAANRVPTDPFWLVVTAFEGRLDDDPEGFADLLGHVFPLATDGDAAHPGSCRVFVAKPSLGHHGGDFAADDAFVCLGVYRELNLSAHARHGGHWNLSRTVTDSGAWLGRFDGGVELRVQLLTKARRVLRDTWLVGAYREIHETCVRAGESAVTETLSGTYHLARPWAERAAVIAAAKQSE